MTTAIRNAISASIAFCVTCAPQLDPTVVTDTAFFPVAGRWYVDAILSPIFSACEVGICPACTCQKAGWPLNGLTSVAFALTPPPLVTIRSSCACVADDEAGTVHSEPPL